MKKSIFGIIINLLAIVAACVGLGYYMINTGTTYFVGLGRDNRVLASVGIAIVLLLVWCVLGQDKKSWQDILPVVSPALIMFGLLTLLNSRINGVAAIMTFENNAQNMADLSSALVAIGALAASAVLACLAAFFDVKKKV